MAVQSSLHVENITQPYVFHFFPAIYLAKRNIRKKGMLEPYEQVPVLCGSHYDYHNKHI